MTRYEFLLRFVVLPGLGGGIGWYLGDVLGATPAIYAATCAALAVVLGAAA